MTSSRKSHLMLLLCLWLTACASTSRPPSDGYSPLGPPPLDSREIDTGEFRAEPGTRDDKFGAEVIKLDDSGDMQSIEINIPIDPDEVDQVKVIGPSGDPIEQSREAQIIQDYENDNVGIKIEVPKSKNMGFRLRLIDHPDKDWYPLDQK